MTADLIADLTRFEALAGKATKGPWAYGGQGWVFVAGPVPESADGGFEDLVAEFYIEPDGVFAAAARTTAPALVAVVRAVLAKTIHSSDRTLGQFDSGYKAALADIEAAITKAWEAQR